MMCVLSVGTQQCVSPSLTKILLRLGRTGQSWCKFRMDEVARRCDPYVHFTEDATLCAFSQMASVSPPD